MHAASPVVVESVRLIISGAGVNTDAPLLDDFLDQVRDFFAMFQGVEAALSGDDTDHAVWRVTDASRNSPLQLTATAFPARAGAAVNERVRQAKRATTDGLRLLMIKGERPAFFTDNVLDAADRFMRRVASGKSQTIVDDEIGVQPLAITSGAARETIENIRLAFDPAPLRTYRELGSIEGTIKRVGKDALGHPLLWMERRLDGTEVKCFLEGEALRMVERGTVSDVVFKNRKAEVTGQIEYRSLGRVSGATVHTIRFAPDPAKLPTLAEVIDPDFTGGMRSETYLARLRSGG